jgi:cytochrome c556
MKKRAKAAPLIDTLNQEATMKYLSTAVMAAALMMAGAAPAADSQAPAKAGGGVKPLALRKIMQGLDADMQAIAGGIAREDWPMVARLAPRIAEHAQPPATEQQRVLSFLGKDADTFEHYDEQTHHAAETLHEAAARADGKGAIAAYATIQNTCLACHQSFRKPIVTHFYGQR